MIDLLIVSKDRACQLKLLLDSIARYATNTFKIRINYTSSGNDYEKAYDKLKSESDGEVVWKREENLREDFIDTLKECDTGFVCISTDDTVLYQPLSGRMRDIKELLDNQTLCFSFRLGFNTIVQDYRDGRLQPPLTQWETPKIGKHYDGNFIRWPYTEYHQFNNYGYPIGMDFCMYRVEDILPITEELSFETFRTWEGVLAGDWRHRFHHKPLIASFRHSVAVNIPTNESQGGLYAGMKYPMSLDELNKKYLDGQTLDLDAMDFSEIRGCHQEIKLEFSEKT